LPDVDDLDSVPWWDATALRMADAIERSVTRLRLDAQGEFVAIINAIVMQLESRHSVPEVVHRLADGLEVLAAARPTKAEDPRASVKPSTDSSSASSHHLALQTDAKQLPVTGVTY